MYNGGNIIMVSNQTRCIGILLGLISVGYGLFLTYKILVHIIATELMWFVFWTYVPVVFLVAIIIKLVEDD